MAKSKGRDREPHLEAFGNWAGGDGSLDPGPEQSQVRRRWLDVGVKEKRKIQGSS